MTTVRLCATCRTPIPEDAPHGICPKCLLRPSITAGSGGAATGPPSPSPRGAKEQPPAIAEVARLFPQLEILELLGQGGMGMVYKARQPHLDRIVALKLLPVEASRDPNFSDRFAREARALARLNHPNIVGIYDFGRAGESYYFLMEYVDGLSLRQLQQARRLTPAEALAMIPKICDALQYAHDEGVVHRDIKPGNILLDKKGRVKVADFGLAKLGNLSETDRALTLPNHVMGTPHYMAPEQLERPLEVDHRADIYSLGVVLYEMLTGELPLGRFAVPSEKAMTDVRLDEVVMRTLEKDPARRFQHASDVKSNIESISGLMEHLPASMRHAIGFEYKSRLQIFGWPLLHVTSGIDMSTGKARVAKGIIAIGEYANGVIAMGGVACGGFTFGGVSVGLFSCGGVSLGLFTSGGLALALIFAWGGISIAPIATGGLAVGYYAAGGFTAAVHGVGGNSNDLEAGEFFAGWSWTWVTLVGIGVMLAAFVVSSLVPVYCRRRLDRAEAEARG